MRVPTKYIILFGAVGSLLFRGETFGQEPTDRAPSDPVITVHLCSESKGSTPAGADRCATIVTREQFETLMRALHPGEELPPNARNNLAKLYAEYLVVEDAARKAGMEDTAEFHEFMNWMRVLASSKYYRRKLQQQYSIPSSDEIHSYYQEHLAEYESARLARVLIPREDPTTRVPFDQKARQVANTAREALVMGLDPAEGQRNGYSAVGLEGAPAVDIGKQRREDLAAEAAAEVFSVKPGEVTPVLTEPQNYIVYKIVDRQTATEADVKQSISRQLMERNFTEAMKSLLEGLPVELDERYFRAPTATTAEPIRNPHRPVAR